MKKALALVLALVLALSLGVSAFALTLVPLKPATSGSSSLIPINDIEFVDGESVVIAGEGGTYYVKLDDEPYKNVSVSATGSVSAKVVEYDPTKFEPVDEIAYYVYDKLAKEVVAPESTNDSEVLFPSENGYSWMYTDDGYVWVTGSDEDGWVVTEEYADIKAICAILNKAEKTTKYVPMTDANTTLIEITVEDNYSAAYKEGSVKISATLNKKAVSATLTVIRDVTIFKYEEVKYAAQYGDVLTVGQDGYSDYLTDVYGYETVDLSSYNQDGATVVSTTAFRAIKGEELEVVAGPMTVNIPEIDSAQKGVNFSYYEVKYVDANKDGDIEKVAFGFNGNQVIASDFTITVDFDGLDYFELREKFGKKVEEEDILTYYVLKDGKVYDKFTVDYMSIDPTDEIELEITGKAGSTLGQYEIVLEVPSSSTEGEENPNTGAESVIGVVAAMAVVSVAAAAAVSLKK